MTLQPIKRFWVALALAAAASGSAVAQEGAPDAGAAAPVSADPAAPPAPPTEDNLEGGWVTASSEHFVLYTEGGARVARRSLLEAERSYAALREAVSLNLEPVPLRGRLKLVLIASRRLYVRFAPLRSSGLSVIATTWDEDDRILVQGAGQFRVLQHELTHRLSAPRFPLAPLWVLEGLAKYYEWTQVGEASFTIGTTEQTLAARRLEYGASYLPKLHELLRATPAQFHGPLAGAHYTAALLLVTALNSSETLRPRFNRLLAALGRGTPFEQAWAASFDAAALAEVEREYQGQREKGPLALERKWQAPPPPQVTPRLLPIADGLAFAAALHGRRSGPWAQEAVERALALAPEHAEAWARKALLAASPAEGLAAAEKSVALAASLPLAWQAFGFLLWSRHDPADRARLVEVAARLDSFADSPASAQIASLAWEEAGQHARAVAAARRAVKLAPDSLCAKAALARTAGAPRCPDKAAERAPEGPAELERSSTLEARAACTCFAFGP